MVQNRQHTWRHSNGNRRHATAPAIYLTLFYDTTVKNQSCQQRKTWTFDDKRHSPLKNAVFDQNPQNIIIQSLTDFNLPFRLQRAERSSWTFEANNLNAPRKRQRQRLNWAVFIRKNGMFHTVPYGCIRLPWKRKKKYRHDFAKNAPLLPKTEKNTMLKSYSIEAYE